MALWNRWLVRASDPYDYMATGPYCVQCRATNQVLGYGTQEECRAMASKANRGAK